MKSTVEQLRAAALLLAVQEAEEGPALAQRVRAAQEEILARRGRDGRDLRWIAIPSELLRAIIDRLDGVASTARHLGVVPMTIQRWRSRGRIPAWALDRCRELIASGAPSRRRPNRAATRHYLPKGELLGLG